jgi:hypothetical protein
MSKNEKTVLTLVIGILLGAFIMFLIFLCIPDKVIIEKTLTQFKAGDIVEMALESSESGTDYMVATQVYKIDPNDGLEIVLYACGDSGDIMFCPPDKLKIVAHVDLACSPHGGNQ